MFLGDGPVALHTSLTFEGKGERLIATARNNSSTPIQHVKICIASASIKKGCLFEISNSAVWSAGMDLNFNVITTKKVPDLSHDAMIEEYVSLAKQGAGTQPRVPSKFDSIRKIYVEELGGNTGPILRDQIIAALVNSGRFVAVEKPDLSDATIRGRSDSTSNATAVSTTSRNNASAIAGVVIGGAKSASVTEEIVKDSVSVRLTLPSGEVIWAWDGSKPCSQAKAQCAVQDLTATAYQ
jgi:hypothetical protein